MAKPLIRNMRLLIIAVFLLAAGSYGADINSTLVTADKSLVVYTSSRLLLSNIGYYLILVIAFFSSLKVLGVNLTSLAVVAGALSVGMVLGCRISYRTSFPDSF